jgi:hypothetical protein
MAILQETDSHSRVSARLWVVTGAQRFESVYLIGNHYYPNYSESVPQKKKTSNLNWNVATRFLVSHVVHFRNLDDRIALFLLVGIH